MDSSTAPNSLEPVLIYKSKKEIMTFDRIVVPSSMRSSYWKFFGFPADKFNNIINKNKIVCALCQVTIAYNKNTTNLQTHLNAKHPDIVKTFFPNEKSSNDIGNGSVQRKRLLATTVAATTAVQTIMPANAASSSATASTATIMTADDLKAKRIKIEIPTSKTEWENGVCIRTIPPQQHPTGISIKAVLNTNDDCNENYEESLKYLDRVENDEFIDELDGQNTEYIEVNSEQYEIDDEAEQINETEDGNRIDYTSENQCYSIEIESVPHTDNKPDDDDDGDTSAGDNYKIHVSNDNKKTAAKLKSPKKMQLLSSRNVINIEEDLTAFIIKDILSPDIVDGKGFRNLILKLYGNIDIPSGAQIRKNLLSTYDEASAATIEHLQLIHDKRFYSISIEKWHSVESNSQFTSIFVNYLDTNENNVGVLRSLILDIVQGSFTHNLWSKAIESILPNLSMCKGVVANFEIDEDDDFYRYLKSKDIPLVEEFPSIICKAIDKCLALTEINEAFDDVLSYIETVDGGTAEITYKFRDKSESWLIKFELMTYFLQKADERTISVDSIKVIRILVETLTPIKNCLDILLQERQTLSSVMHPLTQQLVNQFYTIDGTEEGDIECSIKDIILTELTEKVLNNWFLTVAAFLDPRFQTFKNLDDVQRIKEQLEKSLSDDDKLSEDKTLKIVTVKAEKLQATTRKSGLSSFFNSTKMTPKPSPKNKFDVEFISYSSVNIDIESCPLAWWRSSELIYPNLKKIAEQYNCVPCTVGDIGLTLNDKLKFFHQRKMTVNEFDRKLLWIHYNNELNDNQKFNEII